MKEAGLSTPLENSDDPSSGGGEVSVDALLLRALEALPDAFYLFGPDNKVCRNNTAAGKLQSPNDESLRGRSCCEMFWRAEGVEQCIVDRAAAAGETVQIEMLVETENPLPVRVTAYPLNPGEHSSAGGVVVFACDISDLRRAEAEAIANKSFLASIADRTPDEIYALDKSGRITWMNERAESDGLLKMSGRPLLDFIAEESQPIAAESLNRTLEGQDTQSELQTVSSDGTIRDVEAHTSPLWKEGEVDGVLVFLRDVTDRKRAQEVVAQSEKLRAVGELAAGVAHNLNNSLTVIQGRAQLLIRQATDEPAIKSLKVITEAVEDGSKTLRRILEFARRESAEDFAPVELGDLITSSIEIARPKWQRKSAQGKIEVAIERNGPVYVLGEVAELREVVLNLIFNAVDAMPEGGSIEVGARAEIASGCFWVADSGPGMTVEVAERIFEPFFTTKGSRGTGLGLSASHGIISRHHGEILVVSEPGEGTRFEVRLPIHETSAGRSKEPQSHLVESLVDELGIVH
ncbi:MAG TPA: PAS domain-containing protein [Pyrinomonadaceae bacterium]|nr:PAS domain-containing protein [Pyrinomonadaceae bacterium]